MWLSLCVSTRGILKSQRARADARDVVEPIKDVSWHEQIALPWDEFIILRVPLNFKSLLCVIVVAERARQEIVVNLHFLLVSRLVLLFAGKEMRFDDEKRLLLNMRKYSLDFHQTIAYFVVCRFSWREKYYSCNHVVGFKLKAFGDQEIKEGSCATLLKTKISVQSLKKVKGSVPGQSQWQVILDGDLIFF